MLFITNKKKGFTVLEIFITLSVIAVVSAISIYYYNDYVEDARKTVRITNEKLVNEAIERYYKEHMAYPKYMWLDDSIEDIRNKINRGLDSALSSYFINKKISDILLEGSGTNHYDIFFRVSETRKRDNSINLDNSSATDTWKMAKNLRFTNKDFLVHEVKIIEPDSGITAYTFDNGEKFNFPLISNTVPLNNSHDGYNTIAVNKELDIKMVAIPPGTFTMGSPTTEFGRGIYNEKQHQVTISKQFLISKYEITQKQYLLVMGTNPSTVNNNENRPVETVSWNDAIAFCNKLNTDYSRLIPYGYKFDLPTEAQWEYACRAGTTSALNNGKEVTSEQGVCNNVDEVAWYSQNSYDSELRKKTPKVVGGKKANAWGLFDMHGNVAEWCLDKRGNWRIDYSPDPVVDPLGRTDLGENAERIVRGGSWTTETKRIRSAFRDGKTPGTKSDYIGIRVVLVSIE